MLVMGYLGANLEGYLKKLMAQVGNLDEDHRVTLGYFHNGKSENFYTKHNKSNGYDDLSPPNR
jgi:hypothetical protein